MAVAWPRGVWNTAVVSLRDAWASNAESWLGWAQASTNDSYWRFHAQRFLELLPPPGRLTLDIGAGEGRLARDLGRRGHRVVAIDSSPVLARACAKNERSEPAIVADAARLPFRARVADLAVAFMSLQDIDDLDGSIQEAARVLDADGRLCIAVVHPLNSAGRFEESADDRPTPFVIRGSYLESFRYVDEVKRSASAMTFHSQHRPLESYSRALERAGLVIEAIREVTEEDPDDPWHRLPMFLHVSARQ